MSEHPKNPKEGDTWVDPKSEIHWIFNEGAWVENDVTQIIDWKMEAIRANRLYADATHRIAELEQMIADLARPVSDSVALNAKLKAALRVIITECEANEMNPLADACGDIARAALAPEQDK